MSEVSLPVPIIHQLYYYFTTLTLCSTIFFTPFVFYIILTQSKTIKNYKWFLLNHSFWSLLIEIGIGAFKPVMLLPSLSFYIEFSQSSLTTAILFIFYVIFGFICIISTFISTSNRYFTIFPSFLSKYLSTRNFICAGVLALFVAVIPVTGIGITFLSKDFESSYKNAIKFDSFFKDLKEPSLLFIPEKYWKPYFNFLYICLIIGSFVGSAAMLHFFYLIKKNLTVSVEKLQYILLLGSTIQGLTFFYFLIFPLEIIGLAMLFEIPHSACVSCLMFSLMSCHSLADYFVIMLFITPYRKYLIAKFLKIFHCKRFVSVGVPPL